MIDKYLSTGGVLKFLRESQVVCVECVGSTQGGCG